MMADLVLLAVLVTLLVYATGSPVSRTKASSSSNRVQRPTRGQYVKLSLDDDVYERYKVQPERRPANPRRKMVFRPRARAQTLAYERARAQLVPSPDQLSDDPYDQPANYAGSTGFTDPRGQVPRNSIPWRPEPELEASSEEDSPQLDSPEPEMEEIRPSTRGSTGFGGHRRSQSGFRGTTAERRKGHSNGRRRGGGRRASRRASSSKSAARRSKKAKLS